MTPKPNHQGEGGGRPRKFESPEEIEALSKEYFDWCDSQEPPRPYTITGLAESLGTFRSTLIDYESGTYDIEENEETGVKAVKYSYKIKAAKAKVERYAEEHVYDKTAGSVFQLVNLSRNDPYPWKNAQHQEVTGANNGPLQIQITPNQAGIV